MQTDVLNGVLTNMPGYGTRRELYFTGLRPSPEEEWERMRSFLGFKEEDIQAMLETAEPLFRRGCELVVNNYDYLLKNHETAAILGWDHGVDPEHLSERRRFFTVWLARTLGLDMSHEFAFYLFDAGRKHAGHGPRQIHVPEVYVTGAISLVNNTFARFLSEEMPGSTLVPSALAGWNKYLSMHLHMMLMGYQSAVEIDRGDFPLDVFFYGRLRQLTGATQMVINFSPGTRVKDVIKSLLNYYPQIRGEVFDIEWLEKERVDAKGIPWLTVEKAYILKPAGWRLLLNGRGVEFVGGLERTIEPMDVLQIFPPTR